MRRVVIVLSIAALAASTAASAKVFSTPGWCEVDLQGPDFKSTVAGPYASEQDCDKKVAAEDEDAAASVGILFGCEYLKQPMANDK
jgi:hypothetical protein